MCLQGVAEMKSSRAFAAEGGDQVLQPGFCHCLVVFAPGEQAKDLLQLLLAVVANTSARDAMPEPLLKSDGGVTAYSAWATSGSF